MRAFEPQLIAARQDLRGFEVVDPGEIVVFRNAALYFCKFKMDLGTVEREKACEVHQKKLISEAHQKKFSSEVHREQFSRTSLAKVFANKKSSDVHQKMFISEYVFLRIPNASGHCWDRGEVLSAKIQYYGEC